MAVDRQRLAFATEIFLTNMRQQAIAAGKDASKIKRLEDYPEAQRSALMNSVDRAMRSTEPSMDRHYEAWRSNNS